LLGRTVHRRESFIQKDPSVDITHSSNGTKCHYLHHQGLTAICHSHYIPFNAALRTLPTMSCVLYPVVSSCAPIHVPPFAWAPTVQTDPWGF